MTRAQIENLIDAAKSDTEAVDQLALWVARLQNALDARRELAQVPAEDLRRVLEQRR